MTDTLIAGLVDINVRLLPQPTTTPESRRCLGIMDPHKRIETYRRLGHCPLCEGDLDDPLSPVDYGTCYGDVHSACYHEALQQEFDRA